LVPYANLYRRLFDFNFQSLLAWQVKDRWLSDGHGGEFLIAEKG